MKHRRTFLAAVLFGATLTSSGLSAQAVPNSGSPLDPYIDHVTGIVANTGVNCKETTPRTQTFPGNGPIRILAWTWSYEYCWSVEDGKKIMEWGNPIDEPYIASGILGSGWSYDGITVNENRTAPDNCAYFNFEGHFSYEGVPNAWNPRTGDQRVCIGSGAN